jgi:hypothetical protein
MESTSTVAVMTSTSSSANWSADASTSPFTAMDDEPSKYSRVPSQPRRLEYT